MILFSRDLVELILQGQLASGRLRTLAINCPQKAQAEINQGEYSSAVAGQVHGYVRRCRFNADNLNNASIQERFPRGLGLVSHLPKLALREDPKPHASLQQEPGLY
jgi:hypothetical protein